ncbi:hypothetical protein [uncultured Kriegella sp.]|uniref:hypothetical protein n=1 Tax=uncultured Kriegella sp. TaxID=1798910 RepID=UPI0030DB2F0E|tara:strand:- start:449530 stop:450408 length:879 start_codon:yes stop_codon:yes gene_type:complete
MKIKRLVLFSISTLFLSIGNAQTATLSRSKNTKLIKGSVKSLNNDVSNVLIINLNSKKSTISDSLGYFIIEAKLRDSIRFTAVQYLTKEVVISDTIMLQTSVTVNLIENVINLNEVTVTPYNLTGNITNDIKKLNIESRVTSSTLGLPNADLRILPSSERLLLVADRGKYARFMTIEEMLKEDKFLLGFFKLGVMVNTDKTMNRISGKTKQLEDMVAREKSIAAEKEIIANFSKKSISESFDIPEINIDGFLTYCLSQADFSEISQTENVLLIWEYLKRKSIAFKETEYVNE